MARHFWDYVVDYKRRYREYLDRKKIDRVGEEVVDGTLHDMEVGLRAIEENLKLSPNEIRDYRAEVEREVAAA